MPLEEDARARQLRLLSRPVQLSPAGSAAATDVAVADAEPVAKPDAGPDGELDGVGEAVSPDVACRRRPRASSAGPSRVGRVEASMQPPLRALCSGVGRVEPPAPPTPSTLSKRRPGAPPLPAGAGAGRAPAAGAVARTPAAATAESAVRPRDGHNDERADASSRSVVALPRDSAEQQTTSADAGAATPRGSASALPQRAAAGAPRSAAVSQTAPTAPTAGGETTRPLPAVTSSCVVATRSSTRSVEPLKQADRGGAPASHIKTLFVPIAATTTKL